MSDTELVWRVEETCLNAYPSLNQIILRGWLLRFSGGRSRRTNSANPLHSGCAGVETVIGMIETLYRRKKLPTLFRVPSLAAECEKTLEASGYTREGESCVIYGDINAIAAAVDPAVELMQRPTPEWFAAMAKFQGYDAEHLATYRRIIHELALPAAFAALRLNGGLVSLAYGAVHDRLLCYESVITDSYHRGQGLASRVIGALAAWAHDAGAAGACLQVEASNTPARRLYTRFGLANELYRYWYRREPEPQPTDGTRRHDMKDN
jgi:N-acetylglutamate synthase